MTKHARVSSLTEENSLVVEVITYDPVGVINETFLPEFIECSDEVSFGYRYNPTSNTFYLPEGYAKHPDFEVFGYIQIPDDATVDENGFIVFAPPPKFVMINETDFRSALKLTEKILWDTPEVGTNQQKAVITTIKNEFPYPTINDMAEELDLLVSVDVIKEERVAEIISELSN